MTYTGCSNVIYKGITYTSSTIVRDTVISAQGCDSVYNVATITITPIIAVTNNTSQSGCSSVIYNGVTYNSSTVITDTVKSVNSCDSVYNVVTITVTTPITPSVSLNSTSVVANSSPVTFTATATNGGNATIYIFTVNSTVVQTGASNTYTSSTLNVSDTVVCSIISNATCITTTTAVSSQIIMTTNVPLTLLSFHAALAGINADCSWQTTAEVNTDYFIVQRSVDGNSFINISTINATGNASTISNYSYSDANVTDIKNVSVLYYRLQMVDKNGHFTYSKIVKVDLSASIEFSLYPNPVKSNLNVQINYTKSIKGLAQITDLQGKVLQQQSIQLNAGNNTISLNTANLTTGNYILSIKTEDGTLLKQFMKQ